MHGRMHYCSIGMTTVPHQFRCHLLPGCLLRRLELTPGLGSHVSYWSCPACSVRWKVSLRAWLTDWGDPWVQLLASEVSSSYDEQADYEFHRREGNCGPV